VDLSNYYAERLIKKLPNFGSFFYFMKRSHQHQILTQVIVSTHFVFGSGSLTITNVVAVKVYEYVRVEFMEMPPVLP
jgi:hypothetical protein